MRSVADGCPEGDNERAGAEVSRRSLLAAHNEPQGGQASLELPEGMQAPKSLMLCDASLVAAEVRMDRKGVVSWLEAARSV